MSGDFEAVGALATAGLAAHVLDESGADRRVAHGLCANCETPLEGHYCHACGQAGHVHRTVGHIFEEFLHGLYHFDSKAWRTLPRLVFHPGKLTRDYVYGKRARYIAPLALFLLTIFLMFFVYGFLGGPGISDNLQPKAADAPTVAAARQAAIEAGTAMIEPNVNLAIASKTPDTGPAEFARLKAAVAAKQKLLDKANANLRRIQAEAPPPTKAAPSKAADDYSGIDWQDKLRRDASSGQFKAGTGFPIVDARIHEAALDPAFALYKIEQKAYKLSFLLVPLSLPTLWLLFFWRRNVTLYDHTVFALYSLSFMSLLFLTAALLLKFGGPGVTTPVTLVLTTAPLVHMYAQLKGAYQLGRFGALVRTMVLGLSSLITLAFFAAMIVVLGLAT